MKYLWDLTNKEGYGNRLGKYKTNINIGFVKKYFIAPGSVLDIGGGSGRFSMMLKQFGLNTLIVDINEGAVQIAQIHMLEAIKCDFINFTSPKKFEYILAIESITYFESVDVFFQKVKDLIKPDGVFIFTISNKNSWRTQLREFRLNRTKYLFSHNLNELYKIIEKYGFSIIARKGYMWTLVSQKYANCIFVNLFVWLEKMLRLDKFIRQSPWLLIACRYDNYSQPR